MFSNAAYNDLFVFVSLIKCRYLLYRLIVIIMYIGGNRMRPGGLNKIDKLFRDFIEFL